MNKARQPATPIWITLAIFAYPLSLGSVTRLYNEDLLPEWAGLAYVPLGWLQERSMLFQQAMDWYVNMAFVILTQRGDWLQWMGQALKRQTGWNDDTFPHPT